MIRLVAVAVLAAAATVFGGCATDASLSETRGLTRDAPGRSFSGGAAVFDVDRDGRQVILLALDRLPADPDERPTTAPPAGVSIPRSERLGRPTHFRAYLQLVVQHGGGRFTVGQRALGGQVYAHYYVYESLTGPPMIYTAQPGGHIETRAWMWLGGLDADDWTTTGTYDLLMSNELRVTGSFRARRDAKAVADFLEDKRL